ncbi:hypothetical protein GWO43_02300 [candidate division KSB1 bacterium]|nr:hypothetical protein [candidate division KSB1 bacterium]NIR69696.1 hypothetical protein [candidate division KSB1 bacterium]NIS24892.1 hypothetical protein [candidate division KSB1 bacterium]NIT69741.1 hypothetical protein [candidate division KSB1 bacterium]NIU23411.1 hypothetical protein [candidate division KSB1 bacterium]
MTNKRLSIAVSALILLAALAGSYYIGLYRPAVSETVSEQEASRLNDLASIDELVQVFQSDSGKVRLITLLSPT